MGSLETVSLLVSSGCYLHVKDKSGRTPLHMSAGANHLEGATALLTAGAPIDAPDALGRAPVHLAAGKGYHEMVALLAEMGANMNATDEVRFGVAVMSRHTTLTHNHHDVAPTLHTGRQHAGPCCGTVGRCCYAERHCACWC